jgi:predicted ATPase
MNPPAQLRIVLTGGPGAGKSVIAAEVVRRWPDRLTLVPEAATQVYTMLNTRWDRLAIEERRDAQRLIYRTQVAQELRIAEAHPDRHLLLDRGTIDGAAYWPDGPDAYWRDLNTSIDVQLARYAAVLLLETAAVLGIYDGDASNRVRFEDADAAIAAQRTLLALWRGHPRLVEVSASPSLEAKIDRVLGVLDTILPPGNALKPTPRTAS